MEFKEEQSAIKYVNENVSVRAIEDGTNESPFLVFDLESLNRVRNNLKACYKLTADIDLSGVAFTPIGSSSLPFTGVFDGGGHTIRNLKITSSGNYVGLFGYAKSSTIRNIKLGNVIITNAQNYSGCLAGYLNTCIVENISIFKIMVNGNQYTGGLAGYTVGGTVRYCSVQEEITVNGTNWVGGLVGMMEKNAARVEVCCVKGNVNGSKNVGGLIGYAKDTVSNSYAIGSVASVNNDTYTGGLIGCATEATIANCFSACKLSPRASGLLYGTYNVSVENSFYDIQIAPVAISNSYNVGKLTVAMISKDTFKTWNLTAKWNIEEGKTYPYLRAIDKTGVNPVKVGIQEGMGTKENPYLIDNGTALNCIRYELSACYKLKADIDLGGVEFTSIGSQELPFTGRLDGDGHTVKNFTITRYSTHAGMFGYAKSAVISNLKLEQGIVKSTQNNTGCLAGYLETCTVENISLMRVSVTGKWYTGGLAGQAVGGTIRACAAQEEIEVKGERYVGGLLGRTENGTKVEICCAKGTVTGSEYLGGLIGYARDIVSNSYAVGSVTSDKNSSYVGGLAGNLDGTVTNSYASCKVSPGGRGLTYAVGSSVSVNSYYDSQIVGASTPEGRNKGKLTTALTQKEGFQGWDFETVWNIEEGETYPYLRAIDKTGVNPVKVGIQEGMGTKENPYLIDNGTALNCIRYELSACYKLMADIDLGGVEFTPIGSQGLPFTGRLDGDGHTVKNFTITRYSTHAGMFGYAKSAVISNLKLEQGTVKNTQNNTGCLAGYLETCTVENISLMRVSVTGKWYTGGLAGQAVGGTIRACAAQEEIAVKGERYVGGLLGETENGTKVEICCAKGNVAGSEYLGGLIGNTSDIISNSYAVGSVTSDKNSSYVGGLIGNLGGTVTNSYASCQVSPGGCGLTYASYSSIIQNSYFDSNLANLTTPTTQARTTQQMLNKETFIGWDWDNIWVHDEESYPRLRIIEAVNQEPFQLTFRNLTYSSVIIEWPQIKGVTEYEVSYQGKTVKVSEPTVMIQDLTPDTDYEFKVWATIGEAARIWSKSLSIRTKKILSFTGLHCTSKGVDTITLTWNPLEDTEYYEVEYDNNFNHQGIQKIESNACTLVNLQKEQPYVITVRAVLNNGSTVISCPMIVKLYSLIPQTEYAATFIANCQGQTWFMDEVENLLNMKGKSINAIVSRNDLASIYAIGLADSGVSGMIPNAIGELYCLQYLYLANNDLGGIIPEALSKMEYLIEMDLSGNSFII